MNLEILPLQSVILKRLAVAAGEGKIDEVARLSGMANKTKDLQVAALRIQDEVANLQRALDEDAVGSGAASHSSALATEIEDSPTSRAPGSSIEVTIDWSKNGQPFGKDVIHENLGSKTMARVMERLVKILGERVLEVASKTKVKRGPMISKDPQRDYWNASGKKLYSHLPINGTGYFVLTGTEAGQKVDDLTRLFRTLGLAPGSFSVKKVTR